MLQRPNLAPWDIWSLSLLYSHCRNMTHPSSHLWTGECRTCALSVSRGAAFGHRRRDESSMPRTWKIEYFVKVLRPSTSCRPRRRNISGLHSFRQLEPSWFQTSITTLSIKQRVLYCIDMSLSIRCWYAPRHRAMSRMSWSRTIRLDVHSILLR